jgi:hypothetical protein
MSVLTEWTLSVLEKVSIIKETLMKIIIAEFTVNSRDILFSQDITWFHVKNPKLIAN